MGLVSLFSAPRSSTRVGVKTTRISIWLADSQRRILPTAGGTVVINYNYSICSAQYQQTLTADASGGFTVTQDGIPCENSPLPALYRGVDVTAFDNSSGLNTTQNYHIPCGL